MFGKKYSFDRKGAAETVSKILFKGAEAVASMDNKNKVIGQQIEEAIAEIINRDEDAQLLVRRIEGKFGIDHDLVLIPKVNDDTLLIEAYLICTKNSVGDYAPVKSLADADSLMNYLTEIALSRDDAKMKDFYTAYDKAVKSK